MTKPNAFVFHFTFAVEDDREVMMGFVVTNAAAVIDELLADDFEQMVERLYEEGHFDKLESEFGVHDWSTSPSPEVDAIGFCTYEVPISKIPALMEGWRQVFSLGSPSNFFQLPAAVAERGSDFDIYQYIAALIKPSSESAS